MALAISADGTTVAGTVDDLTLYGTRGWYWRPSTGMVLLPFGVVKGQSVTDAGTMVLGVAGDNSDRRAFRYTIDPPTLFLVPPSPPYGIYPEGASGDGSTLVGYQLNIRSWSPYIWREQSGYRYLPSVSGTDEGIAYAATPDGSVVVGEMWNSATLAGSAFRWTAAGGSVALGTLFPNPPFPLVAGSGAYDVTADGSVIVGYTSTPAGARAFRWSAASGMQDIGLPPGGSSELRATAISDDGSVIVGWYRPSEQVTRAFIWDSVSGVRDLRAYLAQLGAPGEIFLWTLDKATGISADGRRIVGWGVDPQGHYQAFLATVPPVPCYSNCDASTTPPVLNVFDFNCFLNRFLAGDSYSNCDSSTTPPVLNVLDFNCFLNRFTLGC